MRIFGTILVNIEHNCSICYFVSTIAHGINKKLNRAFIATYIGEKIKWL